MTTLAQRIGQEFKVLRDNELSLKADQASIDAMFTQDGVSGDITFKGNLIPDGDSVFSIGSSTNKIKDLFVSANTIHLGESTKLEGTTITVDGGENPTSLSNIPTIVGSSLIAKPFTYNPGSGNITVRPSIAFQDSSENSYPISFDTVNYKFSFDALGNYGEGSVVAKNMELGGNLDVDGTLLIGSSGSLRVDGTVNLGYDVNSVINLKGTVNVKETITFEGSPIVFQEGATLGDGNDNVVVNSGLANTFTVTAQNISIDSSGNVSVSGTVDGRDIASDGAALDAIVAASYIDGSSGTTGDILYHNGTSFVKLAAGTEGQILRIGSSGVPEWANPVIE